MAATRRGAVPLLLAAFIACSQCQELRLQNVERKVSGLRSCGTLLWLRSRADRLGPLSDRLQTTLGTPIAKVRDAIKVKNTGSKAADSMTLCYLSSLADGLAILKVSSPHAAASAAHHPHLGRCCFPLCAASWHPAHASALPQVVADKKPLAVSRLDAPPAGAPAGVACFSAAFATPLGRDATAELTALASFVGTQKPNPSQVAQNDPHLLEYRDNTYVVSPYTVSVQSTEVGALGAWPGWAASACCSACAGGTWACVLRGLPMGLANRRMIGHSSLLLPPPPFSNARAPSDTQCRMLCVLRR